MKRENVRKLIKSIREGDFNWGDPDLCLEGHIRKIEGSRVSISKFLGVDSDLGFELYIGKDGNGERLPGVEGNLFEVWNGENNPAHKKAVLKYLRQFRG